MLNLHESDVFLNLQDYYPRNPRKVLLILDKADVKKKRFYNTCTSYSDENHIFAPQGNVTGFLSLQIYFNNLSYAHTFV